MGGECSPSHTQAGPHPDPARSSYQTVEESKRFGIETARSNAGEIPAPIVVTNYERLHHFSPGDFGGVVCDESSILKNFEGATKAEITEFMRELSYRLLLTATAAPNDYLELGTSSEALGYLGYQDMITRFFKKEDGGGGGGLGWGRKNIYRFRGHAEQPFWRWVCSWARACRKPSDIGFPDVGFELPPLIEDEIFIEAETARTGMLFAMPAENLQEQREEEKLTLADRCAKAAQIAQAESSPCVIWCNLNQEADALTKLIPGSVQISGSMKEQAKEDAFLKFQAGDIQALIIKPRIGCFGLNWQHCNRVIFFASHSWEQYYQAVRRCWRFGQKKPVHVSIIASKGQSGVLENLQRKSDAANKMFANLCQYMNEAMGVDGSYQFDRKEKVPTWL